jgi:hypothetical protein
VLAQVIIEPSMAAVHVKLTPSTNGISLKLYGSGIGSLPNAVPYSGDSDYFVMKYTTNSWCAGNTGNLLTNGCGNADAITGDYTKWAADEIDVSFVTTGWGWKD